MSTNPTADLGLIDVQPVSGNIGAEIVGVDLAQPLAPDAVAEIRAALLRWKVIFFRGQHISPAQHIEFGGLFGDVTPAHPTLPAAFPDHPEILLLDNTRTIEQDGRRIDNRWHTDVSFAPNPPMASILRGVVVPPYGGDTQWTNLELAYERLSPQIRDLIDGLHAVHTNELPLESGHTTTGLGAQFQSTPITTIHPVVRVHPETGARSLFVNPQFTKYIVELTRSEGAHVLAMLYEHISRAEFTVRFRWEPDSIAFWDNRCTAHLVPRDVPAGVQRSMQRITLAGDVPVGVDGELSQAVAGELFGAAR
ncbi:MAG: TauD/TfdA family dioxygenase [Acidimicrobiales bacterium]|nr:TauD/TfdA family dioxygenase [Acidimicrobiales bacterium]